METASLSDQSDFDTLVRSLRCQTSHFREHSISEPP